MRKRSAEEKQKQLERFLMNVAEAADAALWEYWREKEAEHRRFATEYVIFCACVLSCHAGAFYFVYLGPNCPEVGKGGPGCRSPPPSVQIAIHPLTI